MPTFDQTEKAVAELKKLLDAAELLAMVWSDIEPCDSDCKVNDFTKRKIEEWMKSDG